MKVVERRIQPTEWRGELVSSAGIPDLLVEPIQLDTSENLERSHLLSFDDHLLRRFGLLELIRKQPEDLVELRLRSVADEIWFMLEGHICCIARDLRRGSPSEGLEMQLEFSDPARIMVPFGVAFGWAPIGSPALMLRCSTHEDGEHPDDRMIYIEASG